MPVSKVVGRGMEVEERIAQWRRKGNKVRSIGRKV